MKTNKMTKLATFALGGLVALATLAQAQDTRKSANTVPDFSLIGFATMEGGTTGGAGGGTGTVSTASEFIAAATSSVKSNIFVSGTIDLGNAAVRIKSNKSVIGLGTNAGVVGTIAIADASNVIIRNLHIITPPGVSGRDGMSTTRAHHIWVDHCSFGQCTDGQFDITQGSDYVTVSWCKFYYTDPAIGHRNSMLVGNRDDVGAQDSGHLKVTLHHNWWGTLADQRMPRVRFGQVHIFNTYYSAASNNYCIGLGCSSQVLLENSCFDGVKKPWNNMSTTNCTQGIIHWNDDNVFLGSAASTWATNSTVFTPPYSYKPDSGSSVKATVMNHAGVGKGPFAPK